MPKASWWTGRSMCINVLIFSVLTSQGTVCSVKKSHKDYIGRSLLYVTGLRSGNVRAGSHYLSTAIIHCLGFSDKGNYALQVRHVALPCFNSPHKTYVKNFNFCSTNMKTPQRWHTSRSLRLPVVTPYKFDSVTLTFLPWTHGRFSS